MISFRSQFAILGRKILYIQNLSHKAVLKVFNILNIQNLNDIVLQPVCYFGT